jgi:hypothetical protein
MVQLFIGVIGLIAIFLVTRQDPLLRRWGNVVGIVGQPFWILETFKSQQWGMLFLSVGFVVIYLDGCRFLLGYLKWPRGEERLGVRPSPPSGESMEQILSYADRNSIPLPPSVKEEPKRLREWISNELISRCGLTQWAKGTLATRRNISWESSAKARIEKHLTAIPEIKKVNFVGFYRVTSEARNSTWWTSKVQAITNSGTFMLEVEVPRD